MKLHIALLALVVGWQATSAQATVLRILTYNIHIGGLGTDGVRDLDRIADVINSANPDIVAIQEVDKNVPRSGNVNQMYQLGQMTGMQHYFGMASTLSGGQVGNGILVKNGIDIVSTTNYALPNPDNADPSRAVIKMSLSVDDNASTVEFDFFATHLYHNSSAGRQASADFINDLVENSTMPSILAGDMNYNPGSTAFNITANEWTDLTNINNSGKNRNNQIDYIFYRGNEWEEVTKSQFIVNSLTNVASDHHPLLGVLELPNPWPDKALVWNVGQAVETAFTDGFATGNGNGQVGFFPASPWSTEYNTGEQNLIIGYNGNATFSGSASRTIGSMRIGTDAAAAVITGRNGNGEMSASGSVSLTVADVGSSTGDLTLGEGGFDGTLNWNSSGTLDVQGSLRVGQGGDGILNQNGGVVMGGSNGGGTQFIGIGIGAGSTGSYNLDDGALRPGGGFGGGQLREIKVGQGGAGALNVGNGSGGANTASVETNNHILIGSDGGTGSMQVVADGRVEIRTNGSNNPELRVGVDGVGVVNQTGGVVTNDASVVIGDNSTGNGSYSISGGSLATATDGSGAFQIGDAGATGTLHVSGSASVSHGAEMYVGSGSASSTGRLELIGNAATMQIGQLANADGANETIHWQASSGGVTPIQITGAGPLTSNRVQLQNLTEAAANSGSGSTLSGDGISLGLNLQAVATSATLTLIDNQTSDAVTGFFENPHLANDLYEEGASIYGSGYEGLVNISYAGGTGNDVVLNMVRLEDDPRLIVRLKGDSVAGGNGAAVSSWSDAVTGDSFNGSVSQTSSGAQPVKRTGVLNGHDVVEFDGTNDAMLSSQTNSLPTTGEGVTIFVVAQADQGGAAAERVAQLGRSDGAAGRVVGMDLSSTTTSVSDGGTGFRYNNGRSSYNAGIADSDFHIIAFRVDHNSSYDSATMFVDGTLAANTFTGSSSNPSGVTQLNGSTLELILGTGRLSGGGLTPNDYYQGQIAEFLVYNDQMTVDEINVIGDYLSFKYDLPFAFLGAPGGGGGGVPEPSAITLVLLAAACIAKNRRKRQ